MNAFQFKSPVSVRLLKILTVGLLLSAFCVGWAHVHTPGQDWGYVHMCLHCQWVGTPAFTVEGAIGLSILPASGLIVPTPDPMIFRAPHDFPRSRSPPSLSLS